MFQTTYSALLSGLSGTLVEVECFIGNGLPYFNIVGIPSAAAAAARERIRSALKNNGFSLPFCFGVNCFGGNLWRFDL